MAREEVPEEALYRQTAWIVSSSSASFLFHIRHQMKPVQNVLRRVSRDAPRAVHVISGFPASSQVIANQRHQPLPRYCPSSPDKTATPTPVLLAEGSRQAMQMKIVRHV